MQTADGTASPVARAVAWGGALLFVASLGYFLFSYVTRFGHTGGENSRGPAIAIDIALFTIFALHHSVFARERVRAFVARIVPPQLERSFYVWVASLLFVAVCALWQPVPGIAWEASGPARWMLVVLQAIGVWLTLHSAAIIDIFDLSGIRQLSPRPPTVVEFKASGPYRWVRHPIYSGWILLVFCTPLMTMTRLVFAVVSTLYLVIAIPFEERSLIAGSNGAYARYAQEVRWKLLPRVY